MTKVSFVNAAYGFMSEFALTFVIRTAETVK